MFPYYKYIDYEYDRDCTRRIGQYCVDNFDKFMMSSSRECNKYGRYDYNYFLPRDHMCTDLMNELGSNFKIPLPYQENNSPFAKTIKVGFNLIEYAF